MTDDWWAKKEKELQAELHELEAHYPHNEQLTDEKRDILNRVNLFEECQTQRNLDVALAKSVQRTKDFAEVMKGTITQGALKQFLEETCISSCELDVNGIELDCGDLSEVEFILPDNRCVCKDCFIDEMLKELGGGK